MKKNSFVLVLFLVLGLLAGTLIGHLLADVKGLGVLTRSVGISWDPKADLDFVKYEIHIQVKLTVWNLLGLIAAIWLYRKL